MKPDLKEIVKRALVLAEEQNRTTRNPGICLNCGEEQEGCEPDMERGTCESCGEKKVYGAMEVIVRFGSVMET